MALVPNVFTTKTGSPRRTARGLRWSHAPANYPNEVTVPLPACGNCSKFDDHNPCYFVGSQPGPGESIQDNVPSTQKIGWRDLHRLFGVLDVVTGLAWGPIDTVYNAGSGGDNAYQHVDYEIISVSGSTIRLKGTNPKRIPITATRSDLDSYLGGGPLIVGDTSYYVLPVGSFVEFLYPSAKHRDSPLPLRPRILSVSPPAGTSDDLEFNITVSADCTNANVPYDLNYPPDDGKYYARVYFTAIRPADWPRWERPKIRNFALQTRSWTGEELALLVDPSAIELTDTDGGSTLMYPPGHGPTGQAYLRVYRNGVRSTVDLTTRVTVTQSSVTAFTSHLDLSVEAADETVDRVELRYLALATSNDAAGARIALQGKCSNCHHDPTGSYIHHGDERCLASAAGATKLNDFREGCMLWNCSHFATGSEAASTGTLVKPKPADWRQSRRMSKFWFNVDWTLQQALAGASGPSAFYLNRPSGGAPSLGELCGYLRASAPSGLIESTELWRSPVFGVRTVDGTEQTLTFGTYTLRDDWAFDDDPPDGVLAECSASWKSGKTIAGYSPTGGLDLYPSMGPGAVKLTSLSHVRPTGHLVTDLVTGAEAYVTGVLISAASDSDPDAIRLRATLEALNV